MITTLNTEEIKNQIDLLQARIKELNQQILELEIQFELNKKEAQSKSKEIVKDYKPQGLGLSLPEFGGETINETQIFEELSKLFKLEN